MLVVFCDPGFEWVCDTFVVDGAPRFSDVPNCRFVETRPGVISRPSFLGGVYSHESKDVGVFGWSTLPHPRAAAGCLTWFSQRRGDKLVSLRRVRDFRGQMCFNPVESLFSMNYFLSYVKTIQNDP
jgi:hypothetical protein